MRRTLLSLLILAALAGWAAAAGNGVEGFWDGSIKIPGVVLGIRVHLVHGDDGAWSGTIDIPMQGAKDLPLSNISVRGDSVTFSIAGVSGSPTFNGVRNGDKIAGSFSQSGQSFDFGLTRGTAEAPKRPQDPEPPFPYSSEDTTFTNGDITLSGTLTVPEGDGPFPAVVLLSGSGPQNRNEEVFGHRPFLVIADYLSRRGVAVLRYDDRGVGGSTGSTSQSTTADFAGDALAAVELLRADKRIAPDRVGLLGHSEGALVAPLAASESKDVAFIILLAAPAVPIPDLLAEQAERIARAEGASEETVAKTVELNRELTTLLTSDASEDSIRAGVRRVVMKQLELSTAGERPSGEVVEKMIQANIRSVLSPWFQYFIHTDPRVALRKVTVPVLAIYGSLDTQVSDTQNVPALEAALAESGNDDVTVGSMPGLNHMFQHATSGDVTEYSEIDETISPEVLEIIDQWIAERFQ